MLDDLVMRGLAPTGPGTARLGTRSQRPNKGRNMHAMMHFDGKYRPALMGAGRLGSNNFGAQEQFSRTRRSATNLRVAQGKAAGEYRYKVSSYAEHGRSDFWHRETTDAKRRDMDDGCGVPRRAIIVGRSNRRMSNFTHLL